MYIGNMRGERSLSGYTRGDIQSLYHLEVSAKLFLGTNLSLVL